MLLDGVSQAAFITAMEARLGTNYTDEQKKLISAFGDGPAFCFADPGTGKTYSAIGGLLMAELLKGIPGNQIYALSFTTLATGELAVRHEKACQKLGVSRQVNFKTLHALCRQILKDNHKLLGMTSFDSTEALSIGDAYKLVESSCEELGIAVTPAQIRGCIKASNALNAALVFDEDVVKTKMAFKQANVDYEIFDKIRGLLFSYSLLTETISVSDLLLYTLMLLTRHPEVSDKFKAQCKLMLVDEAQDLSLLQLRIISMLTDNPIFIGDMKQQIYAFNGACQEVVEAFYKLFPTATSLELTQSFRCKNNIADYATKIILPNKIGGENYKGVGPGGTVDVVCGLYEMGLDIQGLCEELHNVYIANLNKFPKEYLFLARNNISIIPVVEELYKQGLPFRVNKYKPAYDVPVIKELCELLQLCQSPKVYTNILALRYLIPEFQGYYNLKEHPYWRICQHSGCSIFDVNYEFRDIGLGSTAMSTLLEVAEMINNGAHVTELFNKLWPQFEECYLRNNAWKLENKPEYYINSVNALCHKTYAKFITDETQKINIIKESERMSRGIRCYTMHGSKGLEADIVYIIDADKDVIPNTSQLDKMVKANCMIDAARSIREERSLCYVAITRAREEVKIVYNSEPAPMLLGSNPYPDFDALYEVNKSLGDDIRAFELFTERYTP